MPIGEIVMSATGNIDAACVLFDFCERCKIGPKWDNVVKRVLETKEHREELMKLLTIGNPQPLKFIQRAKEIYTGFQSIQVIKKAKVKREDIVEHTIQTSKLPLFPFQKDAVRYLASHRGLVLSYDTGNGKTLVAVICSLVFLAQNPGKKVHVIAPKSLISNFKIALSKQGLLEDDDRFVFYTYHKFATVYKENQDVLRDQFVIMDEVHNIRTDTVKASSRAVGNYYNKMMARHKKNKEYKKRHSTLLMKSFSQDLTTDETIEMSTLEEMIKNTELTPGEQNLVGRMRIIRRVTRSMQSEDFFDPRRYIKRVLKIDIIQELQRSICAVLAPMVAQKVLLLTATPLCNDSMDVKNLYSIVKGKPIMSNPFFKKIIAPINFRAHFRNMFAFQHIAPDDPDFPRLTEEVVKIEMTPDYYRQYMAVEIGELMKFGAPYAFYCGLRQGTLGIAPNPKCEWVLNKIKQFNGNKMPTLIYSAFITYGLRVIQRKLKEAKIEFAEITGSVPKKERQRAVGRYNSGKIQFLFISNAGGEGLDLKGTRYIFMLESEWNLAQELQVIGRGPRRKSHEHLEEKDRHVHVYRLKMIKPKRVPVNLCISKMENHYRVLNISQDASKQRIKQAFMNLALHYHPDKNSAPRAAEMYKKVYEAYECLRDDKKRKEYDLKTIPPETEECLHARPSVDMLLQRIIDRKNATLQPLLASLEHVDIYHC